MCHFATTVAEILVEDFKAPQAQDLHLLPLLSRWRQCSASSQHHQTLVGDIFDSAQKRSVERNPSSRWWRGTGRTRARKLWQDFPGRKFHTRGGIRPVTQSHCRIFPCSRVESIGIATAPINFNEAFQLCSCRSEFFNPHRYYCLSIRIRETPIFLGRRHWVIFILMNKQTDWGVHQSNEENYDLGADRPGDCNKKWSHHFTNFAPDDRRKISFRHSANKISKFETDIIKFMSKTTKVRSTMMCAMELLLLDGRLCNFMTQRRVTGDRRRNSIGKTILFVILFFDSKLTTNY